MPEVQVLLAPITLRQDRMSLAIGEAIATKRQYLRRRIYRPILPTSSHTNGIASPHRERRLDDNTSVGAPFF